MIRTFAGTVLFALLVSLVPAYAHHSFAAEFDLNQPITFTGKVTKMEWANPHIYYYVDVTDANGKVVNYAVEGGPPNVLFRQGWRKDSLKPGDIITVDGYKAKDGSNHVNGRHVTFPDGRKVFAGSPDGGPTDKKN